MQHLEFVKMLIDKDLEGLSAHDTNQYLSGELFVFIDGLLGQTFTGIERDLIQKTQELFEAVIRMIVVWLKKIFTMGKTL